MELTACIHREEGSYWADVPELPGCFASGDTLDEVVLVFPDGMEKVIVPSAPVVRDSGGLLTAARRLGSRLNPVRLLG